MTEYTEIAKGKAGFGDFEWLDSQVKPYNVAITAVVESPMKLFVQNQNYSKILLGNDNEEMVKNVVRFETNLKWNELMYFQFANTLMFNRGATGFNMPPRDWVITDFNNLMNENPHF